MIASPKGIDMKVETLDVMEFNDDGLITRMTAYWGDTNLRVK
jgi:steroid delta-isomerase